jgi:hypothetical protein
MERCCNPNTLAWPNYGGRGVTVCDRWNPRKGGSFENFYADMGDPPGPDYSIDKDKLGDGTLYSPETCCWLDATEQIRNRRNTIIIEYKNQKKPLIIWAKEFGLKYSTLHSRVFHRKWSIEEALTTPVKGSNGQSRF